jgi:CheY-like chemotaxis protein
VALTANALKGQDEIFLANGFDGFVSKPIDTRRLDAALKEFLRDKRPIGQSVPGGSHDEVLLREAFVRDAGKALDAMAPPYNEDDLRLYTINAHAMKNVLISVGETALSKTAGLLEQAGRDRDMAVILSSTPEFLDALRRVIEKNRPQEDDTARNTDEQKAYFGEKMSEMAQACKAGDVMAADKIIDELRQIQWELPLKKRLDAIGGHLLHGDYEDAAEMALREE